MEPPAQKWGARFALLALTALGLFWLSRLDFGQKISTNIIDLIPADERSPELSVVRSLVNDRQARTVLFALRQGKTGADPATTTRFAEALRKSPVFSDVVVLADSSTRDVLGRFVFEHRNDLLLPTWLAEKKSQFDQQHQPANLFSTWLAHQTVQDLEQFLQRPESVAFQDLLPRDPLLLVPKLADQAQGLGFAETSNAQPGLVWALLKPSPFSEEGQQPVFAAIAEASTQAKVNQAGIQILWTGINRFAHDSRVRISAELSWLNTLSLIAVLGVACVFIRKIWKVIHLVPVILFSVLGAWVAATATFSRLHILVFVVGSLLSGVAIDYGFYLYMQPALRPDETYREKLSRLLKPLLSSCLTTVIGFSFLLFSELPLIRQLGVFVSAGLLAALVGAILYFAQLEKPFLETRTLPRPAINRARWFTRTLGLLVATGALFGLSRLQWKDDIRELEVPSPELRANDELVRNFFGDTDEKTMYISRGANVSEARESLARFLAWHDQQFPQNTGASLGWLIPTEANWAALPATIAALPGFETSLRTELPAHGYTPESFDAFFKEWAQLANSPPPRPTYNQLVDDVQSHLTGPLSLLASIGPEGAWFITLGKHAAGAVPPHELNTFPVSQLESLNGLFTRYRSSALRLSAIGLSLVGLSVFVLYGIKRGVRIFCIPAGSCVFAFGLLGLMGSPLNLFHLLGAFLGVCLSHNYAIFSAENADRHEPPPPSIRLSALCTAASFGTLAFSHIPVVSALGTIVTLIVLTALLMVELEPVS